MSESFLSFHTVDSLRCAQGGDEQYCYSGLAFFMLWCQIWCVLSPELPLPLCDHDVDCGWSSSYSHCVILHVVGLLLHYVFVLILWHIRVCHHESCLLRVLLVEMSVFMI
jgi:hypothetical protein